ncbi:MAG: sensor histidine kinase [Betaproteobacteria bacterium]|nr:sensor histidine kinase [Betaproteobacteria bacterium]
MGSVNNKELRELIDHQERIREDERKRIAREIHDELGQYLLALRIEVSLLKDEDNDVKTRREKRVDKILEHVDSTVKSVRTIINNLRPAVLDLGLVPSLEWQARDFERRNGIWCEFHTTDENLFLDDEPSTVLFRVLQETLTNVVRHAKATHVRINLSTDKDRLIMQVIDNGIGMPKVRNRKIKSFGLAGIRERISMLNGEFSIESGETGTALTFILPYGPPEDLFSGYLEKV